MCVEIPRKDNLTELLKMLHMLLKECPKKSTIYMAWWKVDNSDEEVGSKNRRCNFYPEDTFATVILSH